MGCNDVEFALLDETPEWMWWIRLNTERNDEQLCVWTRTCSGSQPTAQFSPTPCIHSNHWHPKNGSPKRKAVWGQLIQRLPLQLGRDTLRMLVDRWRILQQGTINSDWNDRMVSWWAQFVPAKACNVCKGSWLYTSSRSSWRVKRVLWLDNQKGMVSGNERGRAQGSYEYRPPGWDIAPFTMCHHDPLKKRHQSTE